jgi:uncharacterized protein YceH (UPF0502 family)
MAYDPTTRTPTLGLAYTGDTMMNANLQRIDAAIAASGGEGSSEVADLTARVTALEATVTALEARVAALEAVP